MEAVSPFPSLSQAQPPHHRNLHYHNNLHNHRNQLQQHHQQHQLQHQQPQQPHSTASQIEPQIGQLNNNLSLGTAPHPAPPQESPRPTSASRASSSSSPPEPSTVPMPSSGGIAVPSATTQPAQAQQQPPGLPGVPVPPFEGSRSPPGSKNLSHVPCKFYRQGACQAGKACPFSHSADPTSDQAPCKYFQKGNCKFGAKCALAHILPDGRRVGRHGYNHLGLGAKTYVEPNHPSRSTLHNSLVQAQMIPPSRPQFGDIQDGYHYVDQRPQDQVLADGGFASPRLGEMPAISSPLLSSSLRTLGPLDATLPSSFDSNGISLYARLGPIAASVPSKFGLESPPSESRTLKSLHASAFGEDDSIGSMALSPTLGEDTLGHRLQMQSRLRAPFLSTSLPRTGLMLGDWGKDKLQGELLENIGHEEDFIPGSLTGEILTPQENVVRNRRMSGTNHEDHSRFGGLTSPRESASAVGSPIVGSPSRFGPLFTRTKREEEPTLGLGHVGSPLRNSYMGDDNSPFGNLNRASSSDSPIFLASPPRVSALTQTLKHFTLSSDGTGETRPDKLHSKGRTPTTSSNITSIDEEIQFSMDEEDDSSRKAQTAAIPITGARRPSALGTDDDWKAFTKRDIKPLR